MSNSQTSSRFLNKGKLSLIVLLVVIAAGAVAVVKRQLRPSDAQLLAKAETYFESDQYDEAKIVYMNVLQSDPQNAAAIARLGEIWLAQGSPLQAYPFLVETKKRTPENTELRIKLAYTHLAMGAFSEARKEAVELFEQAPTNEEIIVLLANTSFTEEDIIDTEQRLGALVESPETSGAHLASATIAIRRGDLASYEASIEKALALEPESVDAQVALGVLHASRKEWEEAEKSFKRAAANSKPRSAARLKYAELKIQTGDLQEARNDLETITSETPDYLPAWRLLAQVAFNEKNYDEALSALDNIFSRDSIFIDGRILEAKARLAKGDSETALKDLKKLKDTFTKHPMVDYELARAYLANGSPAEAATALGHALAIKPDYTEAILLLAQLNRGTGNPEPVVSAMRDLLERYPGYVQAQLILVQAYQALGRFDQATEILSEQIAEDPKSFRAHFLMGQIRLQQRNFKDAREAFNTAEGLAPENSAAAFFLAEIDLLEDDFASALSRMEGVLKTSPDLPQAYFMRGRAYIAQKDWDQAEKELLKAIELEADFLQAYELLVMTYREAGKLPQAVSQLETYLAQNPDNLQALSRLALIHAEMDEPEKAVQRYERIRSIAPNSVLALNNLAWLYGEELGDLEKAYEMGEKARAQDPNNGAIADTLGWIQYKRGNYRQAMALSREAAGKIPDDPRVQFHLGMASYMMGETDRAREALAKSVEAEGDFPGKEEARKHLAQLGAAGAPTQKRSIEELEAALQESKDNVMLQMQLATACEEAGDWPRAAQAYSEVLRINPQRVEAITQLAALYAGPLHDDAKALEYAKQARELAPDDPKATGILGRLVFRSSDHPWAYTLLKQSVGQLGSDPTALHDLAWAAYSLGHLEEARQSMQKILDSAPEAPESAAAQQFLSLTQFDESTQANVGPKVKSILAEEPDYVPALMAQASLFLTDGNREQAIDCYQQALNKYPNFAQAQKELASIYAADPSKLADAQALAVKARETLAKDTGLARTLAEISFKSNDYAYANTLLREIAGKETLDAKSLYYLGMSHIEMGELKEGTETLERAMNAGLPESMIASAEKALQSDGE